MPASTDQASVSVRQFVERFRPNVIRYNDTFSFLASGLTLADEDIKEYTDEPFAALPPKILALLPRISLFLVPYLDRTPAREKSGAESHFHVLMDKAGEHAIPAALLPITAEEVALLFSVKDRDVGDYHYRFYRAIATLLVDRLPDGVMSQYLGILQEELSAAANGEVDEESWRLKQGLQRRQGKVGRNTKPFLQYGRESFIDTMTLFLHGICCDIDVEPGPRQLPSRYLRKRLSLFRSLFPPPVGYAVFPEDLTES